MIGKGIHRAVLAVACLAFAITVSHAQVAQCDTVASKPVAAVSSRSEADVASEPAADVSAAGADAPADSLASLPASMPKVAFIDKETNYADSIALLRGAPTWVRRYLSTLIRGNVDRTHEQRFDVSFAITPSYTREAGFGIGGALTGLYRIDQRDSVMNPSDVFISINASLNGFYVLTFRGNNLFPDHRSRLSYKAELYRKRLDFWGINSEQTANNPRSVYDRRQIDLKLEYVYKLTRHLYLGAHLRADYTDARHIGNPEYLLGERRQYYVTGAGLSVEFDSRDNLLTPTRGVHLSYRPMFYPKWLGSAPSSFINHTFIANTYLWLPGAVLTAFDLYASFNNSATPWTMREMVASDGIRMRGYYMGSYIDNCQVALQMELRRNVYRRLGAVAWVGVASVFSSPDEFRHAEIKPEWLPNWGIGLRIEFKHNVNARIDYGFGRHTSGLLFAIGEAF